MERIKWIGVLFLAMLGLIGCQQEEKGEAYHFTEENRREVVAELAKGKEADRIMNPMDIDAYENRKEQVAAAIKEVYPDEAIYYQIYYSEPEFENPLVVNSEPTEVASLTKLLIATGVFHEADEGQVDLQKEISLNGDNFVGGTGVLQYEAQPGQVYRVEDLLGLLMMESDNTAYNELYDLVGQDRINEILVDEGYDKSEIRCKMFKAMGTPNVSEVSDIGHILDAIAQGTWVSEDASTQIMEWMKQCQNKTNIPAGLPENIVTYNKTGELDGMENDGAIIDAPKGRYVLVIVSETEAGVDLTSRINELSSKVYQIHEGKE